MTRRDASDPLELVLTGVRQARQLILDASPRSLDQCVPMLEQARAGLEALRDQAAQDETRPKTRLLVDLSKLQRDLAQIGSLLDNAAGFYLGWIQLRGCLTGGYSADGGPAPLEPNRRVSVEG
jgi:hypothetical protein